MAKIKTSQEMIVDLKKQADSLITASVMRKAAEMAGKRAVEIIKERTAQGYDVTGKRFGGYNYSYQVFKKKFLSGAKGKKKTKASASMEKLRARSTENKATKIKDYLRLTGELFSDISYRIQNVSVNNRAATARIELFVKKRSEAKAQGLQSTTGRNKYASYSKKAFLFMGLSRAGMNKTKEEAELTKIFQTVIKENSKIDFKVK